MVNEDGGEVELACWEKHANGRGDRRGRVWE